MKWLLFALCLGLVAMTNAPKNEVNTPALDFTGKTADGKTVSLKDYKGKVVLLDFWASWCVPCKDEFPFLVKLQKKLQNKNFTVLAVNVDVELEKMQNFVAKQEAAPTFPIIFDAQGALPRLYDVDGMPTTVLIDQDGVIRYRHTGFTEKEKKQIVDEVITLLKN
ncbi:MAG: TlpA family protein disulfide reductase [Deferribacteres bacterium]|nr:TlpA family protein disulfide reductase [candidate division KSB1 bacterium]MCB9509893.1 TlpA family protein disulfide reductase [Deferribacteres bacterium]